MLHYNDTYMTSGEKIFSPRSEDGSAGGSGRNVEPSARSPATSPEYLESGTEQKFPFPFYLEFFSGGACKRKIVREDFCEVATGSIAETSSEAISFQNAEIVKWRTARVKYL